MRRLRLLALLGVVLCTANLSASLIAAVTGVEHPLIAIMRCLGVPGACCIVAWASKERR
jgi:hypothetical protein